MIETEPTFLPLNGVEIVDTFAEAFSIKAARLIITADSARWATIAATVMCGNATSVIACDVEAAIERNIPAEETPDADPELRHSSLDSVLIHLRSRSWRQKRLLWRSVLVPM